MKTFTLSLDKDITTKQLEKVCVALVGSLNKLVFTPAALKDKDEKEKKKDDEKKNEEEKEGGREEERLKVGFVGAVDLTGWCVNVEVNYTLLSATLTELKQTHAQVLLGVMNAVSVTGVELVAPPRF
jgi:hypothetical protein